MRLVVAGGAMVLCAGACLAQKPIDAGGISGGTPAGTHQAGAPSQPPASSSSPFDTVPSPFSDTGKQKRNDDRQRRLVNDTQKLLALTSLLKAEVAASGVETMTPEMLKQMDEIEKLAKSVKDKMRD